MKKLLLISMAIISVSFAKAQPVSDIAIIPIGVNLNSILRLQVISGGNIEFAVNTIAQYTGGVPWTAGTMTTFTVSSTTNFAVNLYAEGANLIGTDLGGSLPVTNIGHTVEYAGIGGVVADLGLAAPVVKTLASGKGATSVIITPTGGVGVRIGGDGLKNKFTIKWELATPAVVTAGGPGTLLSQNPKPDRYVINSFLDLDGL